MFGERIQRARRAAGLNQRDAGARVGVSHTMISKYENNQATPGSATLIKLAKVFDVRLDYFFRESRAILEAPVFRKQDGLTVAQAKKVEAKAQDHIDRYLELLNLMPSTHGERFKIPKGLPKLVRSLDHVELIADKVRDAWNLARNPIPNLAGMLEEHGLLVVSVEVGVDSKFDGLATKANEHCVLVTNRNKLGDRQRFTLAHELAHLLLKGRLNSNLAEEDACNRFAGAFLVPKDRVIVELGEHRKQLSWRELFLLKHEWGLSMAAWLHRAREASVLSDARYRTHRKEFEDKGWLVEEPGDQLRREQPTRFEQLVQRAVAEEFISESKGAELLQISASEFRRNQRFG